LGHDLLETETKFRHGFSGCVEQAKIEQVVLEVRTGQVLGGQVRHHAHVVLDVVLGRAYTHGQDAVANRERQGDVRVVWRGGRRQSAEAADERLEERLFQIRSGRADATAADMRSVRLGAQGSSRRGFGHGGITIASCG
jgi:hypothetical protein